MELIFYSSPEIPNVMKALLSKSLLMQIPINDAQNPVQMHFNIGGVELTIRFSTGIALREFVP
jgi:hypothetical protein